MRFGALTIPSGEWADLVERWRSLEDAGLDAIYVADALAHPRDPSRRWFDAYVCLATVANVTERAQLGTLVTSIAFRNPAAVVSSAVTLQSASGGRFELGLGAGEPSSDDTIAQLDELTPAERRDAFQSYVRRVRALLSEDPRTPTVRLTVAAQASGTLRIVAELADTWNTYGGRGLDSAAGREVVRSRTEQLERYCEEIGRDPGEIRRSVLLGAGYIDEQPFRSADTFTEVVDAWRALGFDEIVFYASEIDDRIARETMPSLRA